MLARSVVCNFVEVLYFRRPPGLPIGERTFGELTIRSRVATPEMLNDLELSADHLTLLVTTSQQILDGMGVLLRLAAEPFADEYLGLFLAEDPQHPPTTRARKMFNRSSLQPLVIGEVSPALSFQQVAGEFSRAMTLFALRANDRVLRSASQFREIEARSLNEVGRAMMERIPVGDLFTLILNKAMDSTAADVGCLLLKRDLFEAPKEDDSSIKLLHANHMQFVLERLICRSLPLHISPALLNPTESDFLRVLLEWGGGISWYAGKDNPDFVAGGDYRIPPIAIFEPDLEFDPHRYALRSWVAFPIRTPHQEIVGVVLLVNKRAEPDLACDSPEKIEHHVTAFSQHDLDVIETLVHKAGMSVDNSRLFQDMKILFESFMSASTVAIESRDPATRGHGERVGILAVALAEVINDQTTGFYANKYFSQEQLYELKYASILHDFGKISIDENILRKGFKLHQDEFEVIRARLTYLRERFARETYRRVLLESAEQGLIPDKKLLDRINVELKAFSDSLDGYLQAIAEANRPNVVTTGDFDVIRTLGEIRIQLGEGEEACVLTQEEVEKLSVRRGSLSPVERREIESHVEKAYKYLTQIPWSQDLADVPFFIYCHHERENGSGYPRGIRSAEIPLGAKIMAITDVFDALVAVDRPYKRPIPFEQALAIMQDEVDEGKLEPELFQLFVERRIFDRADLYPEAGALTRKSSAA